MSTAKDVFLMDELEELLKKAVENNGKKNITGLLISKGKTFLQCLEGKKEDVMDLFEKIEKDDRHYDVAVLLDEDADDRLFPEWSMGFRNIDDLVFIESNKVKELCKSDLEYLEKSDIYDIFEYFVS